MIGYICCTDFKNFGYPGIQAEPQIVQELDGKLQRSNSIKQANH